MSSKRATSVAALPPRYDGVTLLRELLDERIASLLRPGLVILDVGAGRRPTILPDARPSPCAYVGIDADPVELEAAEPGAYDETFATDVTELIRPLEGRFDLAVSCYAFEHVKPLPKALENLRMYLRPGGKLVALFSGALSAHAVGNRLVPETLGARLTGRPPETKFPAHYDHCRRGALQRDLATWSEVRITPLFLGAEYFSWSRPLQRAYLAYEGLVARAGLGELASHYLLDATR